MVNLNWPLMKNNITREDLDRAIEHLKSDDPILTSSKNVREFEAEWSKWLGVKYSVMVNSGASANLLTMIALKELYGLGEVIVPPLTWVSDIASVIQAGFKPVFVDIDPQTLAMDTNQVIKMINKKTKAVFLSHILGYNGLTQELLTYLKTKRIPLIEDVCESYGATFKNKKLGNFGIISNFSFYYAHHMSTIEGGMISTNKRNIYEILRLLRAHGMVRESTSDSLKNSYYRRHPDLNRDFIFAYQGFNMRPTEIGAIIGRSQLKRLDTNNKIRSKNLQLFLDNLNPEKYQTDFAVEGSCNYALTLVLKKPDLKLRHKVEVVLKELGVEFRRGTSGGGNQLRQPYLKKLLKVGEYKRYPVVDHIHFFGWYIGNYPSLETKKITKLCQFLNQL